MASKKQAAKKAPPTKAIRPAEQLYGVRVTLADGTSVSFDPSSRKEAHELARSIAREGCDKDGTYYPVHQVVRVKVYEAQTT